MSPCHLYGAGLAPRMLFSKLFRPPKKPWFIEELPAYNKINQVYPDQCEFPGTCLVGGKQEEGLVGLQVDYKYLYLLPWIYI